jgi:hypothetical protein
MAAKGRSAGAQLNVVFDGTWVLAPMTDKSGRIVAVDVYAPACGHPQGATYQACLEPDPWPVSAAFYQLDPHGLTLRIERGNKIRAGMFLRGISGELNHIIPVPRPLRANWDLLVSIAIGPDAWISTGTITPVIIDADGRPVPCFAGKDAPTGKISSTQTLSFRGVTLAQLLGAPAALQDQLPMHWRQSGSLIFEDEIPYIPTLGHERAATLAIANLAGLDLSLNHPLPKNLSTTPSQPSSRSLRDHTGGYCGHAVILLPALN